MSTQLPRVIELDREGLYFVSNDGDYWVYVDTVDREVRVFNSMVYVIAYGLHVKPNEMSVEIIDKGEEAVGGRGWEIRYRNYVVKVCVVGGECEEYKAWSGV
jgi:hypothetical protein